MVFEKCVIKSDVSIKKECLSLADKTKTWFLYLQNGGRDMSCITCIKEE